MTSSSTRTAASSERLPGFPARRLLALVGSADQAEAVVAAVGRHVDASTVRVLSGEQGVRALDVTGSGRGLRGRLARSLHNLAFHRDSLATHEAHLHRGGHLLLVPARTSADCDRLVGVLAACGAHGLLWFARASVVDVAPRRRAVTTPAVLVPVTPPPVAVRRLTAAADSVPLPRQRTQLDDVLPAPATT